MKLLLSTLTMAAIVGLVGCASKDKKTEETNSAAQTAEAVKKEGAKVMDKAKAGVKAAVQGQVTCAKGKDNRTLAIRSEGSGCEVVYTKFEQENVIATSQNGMSHCEATIGKVKSNLENAGFSCN